LFEAAWTSVPLADPQEEQSSKSQDVSSEGLWVQPVKAKRLPVASNRWVSSRAETGAGWSNQETTEPVLLQHVNDPFQKPKAGQVIVSAVGEIQHRRYRVAHVAHCITDFSSPTTDLNKIEIHEGLLSNRFLNKTWASSFTVIINFTNLAQDSSEVIVQVGVRALLVSTKPYRLMHLLINAC